MSDDEKKDDDDEAIHRVDTVPPPPGEDDAYSAPTRVGEMPPEVLEAMRGAGFSVDGAKKSVPKVAVSTLKPPRMPVIDVPPPPPAPPPPPEKQSPEGKGAEAKSPEALPPDAKSPAAKSVRPPAIAPSASKIAVRSDSPLPPLPPPHAEEAPFAQVQREDDEASMELGDSSIEEIPRPYAPDDDDADEAPTQLHANAKALPPALGAGSIPRNAIRIPREALLVLALVVALVTLAVAFGIR